MPKVVEKLIHKMLYSKNYEDHDQMYLYLLQVVCILFAALIHIFALVFFSILQIPMFIGYNLLSISVYGICIVLVNGEKNLLAGLLLTVEVISYSITSIIFFGVDNFISMYLVLILVVQVILPYAKMWVRRLMIGVLWICIVGSVLFHYYGKPIMDLGDMSVVYGIINAHVGIIGVLTALTIGRWINHVLDDYSQLQMEELRAAANIDPLTGLYNRRYTETAFKEIQESEASKNWCVAMLDIDDFKLINDTYGHAAGDRVLVALSNMLSNNLRKTDILFRWGGEEFLIFLKAISLDAAYILLDELRELIAEMRVLSPEGQLLRTTVTIGVTALDVENIEKSIRRSDKNMYRGKLGNKNIVVA